MDHVALDRTGPDDGDLDDEIVERPRLHPRQHRHLGAALDLEGAERVGLADHGVGARVFRRDGREIQFDALRFGQEIERALHAGEHAERQAVDLHEFQGVDVVLVPFDDLAVGHRGRFDRHQFVQPVMRQHEAARMLRQMPRRPDQFAGENDRELEPPVLQVEVEFFGVLGFDAFLRPAPDLGRQHLDQVFGQPQRLADVAQRALGPVADHGRAERRMVAAVGLEHPLHHDLAAFVLEVDVDVGRLAAFLGDEALEQQIVALRIDRGDAEHVADRAVGGRPAALAQDVLGSREADDRVHGQEVRRILQPLDQPQFVLELGPDLVGQAFRIAFCGTFPGQLLQRLLRRQARHRPLFRILVGEFVHAEGAAVGDLDRPRHRFRIAREQPRHLLRRLQIAVGVPLAAEAGLVDRDVVPDAGDDVLQDAPRRFVKQHVVGDDGRHAETAAPGCSVRGSASGRSAAGAASAPCRPGRRRSRAAVGAAARRHRRPRPEQARRSTRPTSRPGPPSSGCTWPCRRASCRRRADGRAGNRPAGRSDRPARTCRRRDRAGSRRSGGRR